MNGWIDRFNKQGLNALQALHQSISSFAYPDMYHEDEGKGAVYTYSHVDDVLNMKVTA